MSTEVWGVWVSGGEGPAQWTYDPTKWTEGNGNVRFEGTEAEAIEEAAGANGRVAHMRDKRRPLYEARRIAP